uniref:R-linalool synthase QH1, chloroplastic-like n=1 Tax=Erigeron canadensis TaxID=72917 RepID=UPI001CB95A67|nr:R-linalool synthase QH1, chloroplastic-like [Erigeron canadensis]
MASMCLFSSPLYNLPKNGFSKKHVDTFGNQLLYSSPKTKVVAVTMETTPKITRRSGNYPPTLWSHDHLQSLTSKYTGEECMARSEVLKEEVRTLIDNENLKSENPLSILNLIDYLERLGIAYHFVNEISNALEDMYECYYKSPEKWIDMDLNLKSLGFRLLRQHGYHIPQDIFGDIKAKTTGIVKRHSKEDIVCMLNLYEASYLSVDDEHILDKARDITTKYLKAISLESIDDQYISSLISHTLAFPLQWRVARLEAKWFIEAYTIRTDMNPMLLEFAKLDYNMVQAIHQQDLKHASRWWRSTSWDKKLSFARDRIMENFLWTVAVNHRPQFSDLRRSLVKIFSMITTIDDVYDVYGTLEELELFTDVVGRWDINVIEELPDYMKTCFFVLHNTINDIAFETFTESEFVILPYVVKAWEDLCKAYLLEAQWYHNGYMPTLEQYLDNARVSISVPLMLMHINFSLSLAVCSTEEVLQNMDKTENIVRYSGLILRFADDLGTSSGEMKRGDVPTSIQCYMHENGATEEEARAYVQMLILETWKKLNKERAGAAKSLYLKEFADCATNFSRMAQFMYQEVDGHGERPDVTKTHILPILVNPI